METTLREEYERLKREVRSCDRCELAGLRDHPYAILNDFEKGPEDNLAEELKAKPRILIVGEAPGAVEAERGLPFVGPAGKLIRNAIRYTLRKMNKEDTYQIIFTNVCLCHPIKNRTPLKEEINECRPFLLAQINLLIPRRILALGATAIMVVNQLCTAPKMKEWSGKEGVCNLGDRLVPVTNLLHPAYLLYRKGDSRDGKVPQELREHYEKVLKEMFEAAEREVR